MKSTLYSEPIKEFNYEKPQLMESLKEKIILLTVNNPDRQNHIWEKGNKHFSGVVVNSGSSKFEIGTIITSQSLSFYTLYNGHIKLEN